VRRDVAVFGWTHVEVVECWEETGVEGQGDQEIQRETHEAQVVVGVEPCARLTGVRHTAMLITGSCRGRSVHPAYRGTSYCYVNHR
jgi:hypothetical protein